MKIRFYNTLTHRQEDFAPLDPPNVYMYNCGPTVYDFAHIGNFRTFIFADLLRRFLEFSGYRVHQVMNLTDVGHMTEDHTADGAGRDKMDVAAERIKEAKKAGKLPPGSVVDPDDPYQVARFYIDAFLADARLLGLKIADDPRNENGIPRDMPRATDHVPQMQAMIARLIAGGHAYVASDGAVYFSVETFPAYGRLSGNTLDKLRGGAGGRVLDEHQAAKKHPADFLLWKPDPTHVMKWDSPWGAGYPGWHIECSAMARALLGRDVIDIHTGGEDNIFPHHECEIAQTCASTDNPTFACFWMHARYLLVDGAKMSKSKGNFYTLRDLMAKGIGQRTIRYELLKAHYRTNMNFTLKGLTDSESAVRKLHDAVRRCGGQKPYDPRQAVQHSVIDHFKESLADDLNISAALGEVFGWLKHDFKGTFEEGLVLREVNHVLGVIPGSDAWLALGPSDGNGSEQHSAASITAVGDYHPEIKAKCDAIDAARRSKDFATADRLRKELLDAGYEIKTTKEGTVARKKLI